MMLLDVVTAPPDPQATFLTQWIIGIMASFILLCATIIFNRMFGSIKDLKTGYESSKDKIWEKINAQQSLISSVTNKMNVLEAGMGKDITMLTDTIKELSTNVHTLQTTLHELTFNVTSLKKNEKN